MTDMDRDAASDEAPLDGILVLELGRRLGVGACGSVLAELGATVVLAEAAAPAFAQRHRATMAAGKRSLAVDPAAAEDLALLQELADDADVVLLSSDTDAAFPGLDLRNAASHRIDCDVTAFGNSGSRAGEAASETLLQAMSGLMDTTGPADGPPLALGIPALEFSSGLYAAAAVLAALAVRRRSGLAQSIDIALYDTAINSLATFLPAHFGGGRPERVGNAHTLVSPWNAYATRDGWVLVCCPSEPQWQRLCAVMERADLAEAAEYANAEARVAHRAELDSEVQKWTGRLSLDACLQALAEAQIPSGPIVTVEALATEPNVVHRGMVRAVDDPVSGDSRRVPGPWLRSSAWESRPAARIPAPDEDRRWIADMLKRRQPAPPVETIEPAAPPLAGLRVLEIGQYTTAPLVGRQLAALGAEVIKIEPPGGDPARTWSPKQGGLSYFFAISNNDKTSLGLDIRREAGTAEFRRLLGGADILVENLKPGALAKLGFDPATLARLNPRLIYCAISGFGADSVYPGRPAVDTIVQAMAGHMDLTRQDEAPYKSGISAADIAGGQSGLVAILAALEMRQRTGRGAFLDVAMQDIALWLTRTGWDEAPRPGAVIGCRDGFVAVDPASDQDAVADLGEEAAGLTRAALVERLGELGVRAAPVATVAEAAAHPETEARRLLLIRRGADGLDWPLLASPLRLSLTPPEVARPIGPPRPSLD